MIINRVWAMPNKHTFTIKPIAELLGRYVGNGYGWLDPFAGFNSPAEVKNDLNPKIPINYHYDALAFLKNIGDVTHKGILLDPPYSITQARQCYDGFGFNELKIKPTSMKYWASVKDNMARIIIPGGLVICCGWSSMGLGKNRGFEMVEILLVPHGGSKNDTIVTVERYNQTLGQ